MDNLTTDFEEYKRKKAEKFKKEKEFEPLSSDIVALKELEDDNIEKVEGPIEIIQITGVITDRDRINKLEEAVVGGPQFNPVGDLNNIKIGSTIWFTAIIKQSTNKSWNAQSSFATIQTRIVNIYAGLNKLKTLK